MQFISDYKTDDLLTLLAEEKSKIWATISQFTPSLVNFFSRGLSRNTGSGNEGESGLKNEAWEDAQELSTPVLASIQVL